MNKKAVIIGGDLRQLYLASSLCDDGFEVNIYGFDSTYIADNRLISFDTVNECVSECSIIILPLPYNCDDGVINAPLSKYNILSESIINSLSEGVLVAGGLLDDKFIKKVTDKKCRAFDYFKRKEFSVLNAIPAAEGIVQLAFEELPVTVHGINALITGFGNVGKQTAKILDALCANVYVYARSKVDLALIKAWSLNPVNKNELYEAAEKCRLIINTIPATLFTKELLPAVSNDALLIDIASKPGGVDMKAANLLGKKVIWALSLPGKVAPVTSGEITKNTIYNILDEFK